MNETQARDAICAIGESLYARGYVHATAGNISVRLEDGGFLITPTDACLGRLKPERLARLDASGRQLSGDRGSKTIALHRAIYAATLDAGHPARSVLHTHSTHALALTLRGLPRAAHEPELLPALTPYFVMKVGRVPLLPYHRPGDPALAQLVAERIAAYAARGIRLQAVMLSRLGPNVWHDDPASAAAVLEELEETARLALLAGDGAVPLEAGHVQELRDTFDAQW
jgi:ribulose-5-phosphate 4-epimerase/fuculose-1-phosphate aldolase